MKHLEKGKFIRGFAVEKCIQCGKCLSECLYQRFTPEEAVAAIKKIMAAPQWRPELAGCIRCGKCDHRCPRDARPSYLMREIYEYKRRADGVPASMAYAINGMGPEGWGSNFFKDVYRGLGADDRKILGEWSTPKKSRDLLLVGCTDRMMPRAVAESRLLGDLGKFGGPDDCCGVWAIQGGLLDEGYRIAKRLVNRLKENRFERLVIACGHCQKVLTRMAPRLLGIDPPFPIISIYDYFLEKIENGSAPVLKPVRYDAAISDPCFGYENGDAYLDAVRNLARGVGMRVSELPHHRETALCCGYGGLFNGGKVADVVRAASIKRKDMAAGGKKHVVSYCPGCHLVNHYFQPGYQSHYLLEEVLAALGDRVTAPFSSFYWRLARPHIAWNLMGVSRSALL